MGIVIERTGNQHFKTSVASFARRRYQIMATNRAKLGPNEDPSPSLRHRLLPPFEVTPFSANVITGPGGKRGEFDLVFFVCLLYTSGS